MRPICKSAGFDPSEKKMTQSVEDIGMRNNIVAEIDDTLPKSIDIQNKVSP